MKGCFCWLTATFYCYFITDFAFTFYLCTVVHALESAGHGSFCDVLIAKVGCMWYCCSWFLCFSFLQYCTLSNSNFQIHKLPL